MELNFNQGWRFRREGGAWENVTLPHDAMITEPRCADAPGGVNSGYFPGGKYEYEKRFSVTDTNKSYVLHFEGVYQHCTVSVGGVICASHRYGYTAFDADISNAVRAGENLVTVTVDNSLQPNCRWYSGSGIYRDVTLRIRDRNFIKTLQIDTVSVSPAVIKVTSDADVVEIYDGDSLIASGTPGEIPIPGARLWSAEHPHLYRCRAKSADDEAWVTFGIRALAWSAKTGLTVNGETVKLRGGCLHHDHGVLGACEYRESEERRIRLLKAQGFNAVRIAHNPASQITLETCDRLGMYVMDECFDGWYVPKTYHDYARWFYDDWKSDLAAMVEPARNHPSVIMYSIGNEVTETATEKGAEVCGELADFVRSLDPTRPVTAGINVLLNVYAKMGLGVYKEKGEYRPEPLENIGSYREKKSGSAFFNAMANKLGRLMFLMSAGKKGENAVKGAAKHLDIVGYNYASSRYDADAKAHPERISVGSETMAANLPYNWERVKQYPQLVGDFVWSAWDYLGEACIGDWTYHSYPGLPLLAGQGMIDITGKPLAAMAFMQTVWGLRNEPFIAVSPLNHIGETPSKGAWQFTNGIDSWTWQGYEGKKATVEVYFVSPRVRLKLNGRTVGERKSKNNRAVFHLRYAPGTLRAEALGEDGSVLSAAELKTGGDETILSVKPEKTTAKPGEIVYVPIEFTDKDDALKPYLEETVALSVTGGELLGFGSALCKTDEVFNQPRHRTYRGRALAVVRAGEGGSVIIKAGSGAYSGEAEIEVAE